MQNKHTDNPRINRVVNLIPDAGSITRAELVHQTGFSDRWVRSYIQQARQNGEVIIATSDRKGYRRPQSAEDLKHYIAEGNSRIRRISESLQGAYIKLEEMYKQEATQL